MNRQKQISANILEGIAKTIGDTNRGLTGSEIGYILQMAKLKDVDPVNTKWRRIYNKNNFGLEFDLGNKKFMKIIYKELNINAK